MTVLELQLRFEKAYDTLKRMPGARKKAMLSHWPDVVQNSIYAFAAKPKTIPPDARDIDDCDHILALLLKADPDERKLLWARAGRIPWRVLSDAFGLSHMTLRKQHKLALERLACAYVHSQGVVIHARSIL